MSTITTVAAQEDDGSHPPVRLLGQRVARVIASRQGTTTFAKPTTSRPGRQMKQRITTKPPFVKCTTMFGATGALHLSPLPLNTNQSNSSLLITPRRCFWLFLALIMVVLILSSQLSNQPSSDVNLSAGCSSSALVCTDTPVNQLCTITPGATLDAALSPCADSSITPIKALKRQTLQPPPVANMEMENSLVELIQTNKFSGFLAYPLEQAQLGKIVNVALPSSSTSLSGEIRIPVITGSLLAETGDKGIESVTQRIPGRNILNADGLILAGKNAAGLRIASSLTPVSWASSATNIGLGLCLATFLMLGGLGDNSPYRPTENRIPMLGEFGNKRNNRKLRHIFRATALPKNEDDKPKSINDAANSFGEIGGDNNGEDDLKVEVSYSDGMTTIDGFVVIQRHKVFITLNRKLSEEDKIRGEEFLLNYARQHKERGIYMWVVTDS